MQKTKIVMACTVDVKIVSELHNTRKELENDAIGLINKDLLSCTVALPSPTAAKTVDTDDNTTTIEHTVLLFMFAILK